jgi:hypothetical protein
MNESQSMSEDEQPTLDPPGKIVVIGAGPLGIEAALYGRFLGYDVTLVEADSVGSSVTQHADASLPILPDRCLSPLAIGALRAQYHETVGLSLPVTVSQWIKEALIPLTESDLLRGRLRVPWRVTRMITVPVEAEEEEEDVSSIPPDFRLTLVDPDGRSETLDAEAVIVAVGGDLAIELGFPLPDPYFFRIGADVSEDWETSLLMGHREIVRIYAQLGGRADLDLYRPKRV